MLLAFLVVLPICIYIIIGIIARRLNWIKDEGIKQTNKLLYMLFFPIVMFNYIYNSHLAETFNLKLILYLLALSLIFYIILILLVPVITKDKPTQASIVQGIIRGNLILFAIPIISTIYGETNTGTVSMCVTFVVPFYNILCVILLESKRGHDIRFKKLILNILKNPIIVGALVGFIIKSLKINLPNVIEDILGNLGAVLTPIVLILLGASLKFQSIKKHTLYLAFVCTVKLVISPLLFITFGYLLGFRGQELTTIFAISCVPTAVSSYVMAKEMEANGDLAGEIVTFTSLFSIFTIFIWLIILTNLNILL